VRKKEEKFCPPVTTEEAHVSSAAFDEIAKLSESYSLPVSSLLSTFVFCQLSNISNSIAIRHAPDRLFGPDFAQCVDAFQLEGWLLPLRHAVTSPPVEQSPLGDLVSAWSELTGEKLPALFLKNLTAQVRSKYGSCAARSPKKIVKMFRELFPEASFSSLLSDTHRFSLTIDSAAQVWDAVSDPQSSRKKWGEIWRIAKIAYPGTPAADDPYIFVPAISPRFSAQEFKKLAGSLELKDALALSACPSGKRMPPDRSALTGVRK
jgi:hypothetical protein